MYLRYFMPTERDIPIIGTVEEMQAAMQRARMDGHTIGCVPTMGALHEGHASLIHYASHHHGVVAVSIFVNPTQFGPGEDFERYPRTIASDVDVVRKAGGTHVFVPSVQEMYPQGAVSTIHVDGVTEMLEGARRPGHFDGVATVVSRLFEAMLPDEAFFGQKDLQQTLVIRRMVASSPLEAVRNVAVTVLPTNREPDGLARSSRNVYLSTEERAVAPVLYKALQTGAAMLDAGERSPNSIEATMRAMLATVEELEVEYAVVVDAFTLRPAPTLESGTTVALIVAARLGTTRLIDNVLVTLEA